MVYIVTCDCRTGSCARTQLIHDFHLSAKNALSQIKTKNILQSKAYEIYQKHALQFTA